MHWYIMPRFPKHMFEGGSLSYPQANTQPDFPKCHTPVPSEVRRDCRALSIMWITWGFPDGNQLQPLHTDLVPESTTHHRATNPCTVPWGTSKGWIPCLCHPGFKQQLSSIPNALNSLSLSCWADLWMLRCFLHTQQPEGLLHLICTASSTAQMAASARSVEGNLGHKSSTFQGETEAVPAVTTGTAQGMCLNPNYSCRSDAKPGFPIYQSRYFCLSLSKHFFLCSETDVTSKIRALLFIFLNTDGNECTTLKMPVGTHRNLHTFNINVSLDKFNLQSSSSEGKFWGFLFSTPALHIFCGKFPMFSKL